MSSKNIRWLYGQLTELVEKGVIDDATSQQLSEHYEMDSVVADKSISVMTIILSAIGGLLVGGGIILIFAHNWENIGRPMRAVLAFLPLLLSQVLCAMALLPKPRSQAWKETAAVLMFCAVPACIALIGQTYHVSDDTEAFLMWWFILLLPIVYLLRPHLTALLMVVLAMVLGCFYQSPYWLCLVALIPYYWIGRQQGESMRQSQFSWFLALSLAVVVPVSLLFEGPEPPIVLMLISGALAMYLYGGNFEPKLGFGKRPFTNIGAIAASVCGLTLSFSDAWRELLRTEYSDFLHFGMNWHSAVLAWILFLVFVSLMIITIKKTNYRLLPLSSLFALVALAFILPYNSGLALTFAIAVNLLMVGVGIWYATLGLKQHSTSMLNFGLLLVMAILMMRFFDQDLSFIGRGIVFIVMGSVFIGINVWHGRRRAA